MSLTETVPVACPCCGEAFDVLVDCSLGDQTYVEDCFVCCQPLVMTVSVDPESGQPTVDATPENA